VRKRSWVGKKLGEGEPKKWGIIPQKKVKREKYLVCNHSRRNCFFGKKVLPQNVFGW
jgi:hypothetical protein